MKRLSPRGANAVIVALDATRDRNENELRLTMNGIRMRGDILRGGDLLLVFGVLHTITNPRKYLRDYRSLSGPQVAHNRNNTVFQYDSMEKPILCALCGLRSVLYIKDSMRFQYSEIQHATSNFSKENFFGEGGFGHVHKGKFPDGLTVAAKVRREASAQGYSEFFSEVHVPSFARHRNIVMLLGYCCRENHNILVYEYICNNSLEWHLFSESAECYNRRAIAIGRAKGLCFLHEECRGGPIIHRDLRPSNIF